MALSFKSPVLERNARELAQLTGETMTKAVETAVAERLERVKPATKKMSVEAMDAFLEEARREFDFSRPITKADFDALWEESER